MLGEVQPLACIHPAQGGVACRDVSGVVTPTVDSVPPHGTSPLRDKPLRGLSNLPYSRRQLSAVEKVNAAKAAQSKRAIRRVAYIPAHKACQIVSRPAATTFSSPGCKPGGCPPSHLQLTQPRPRAGRIHANASIFRCRWVSCLVFPLYLFGFSVHYHKFMHPSRANCKKMSLPPHNAPAPPSPRLPSTLKLRRGLREKSERWFGRALRAACPTLYIVLCTLYIHRVSFSCQLRIGVL